MFRDEAIHTQQKISLRRDFFILQKKIITPHDDYPLCFLVLSVREVLTISCQSIMRVSYMSLLTSIAKSKYGILYSVSRSWWDNTKGNFVQVFSCICEIIVRTIDAHLISNTYVWRSNFTVSTSDATAHPHTVFVVECSNNSPIFATLHPHIALSLSI